MTTIKIMDLFKKEKAVIDISLPQNEAIEMFLCVYLAKERLPHGQLKIVAALATKYAGYVHDGVKEPHASALLFSTETRKEIYEELEISASQFNNAFKPLMDKNILAKDGEKYFINPAILPSTTLEFNFKVNAEQG